MSGTAAVFYDWLVSQHPSTLLVGVVCGVCMRLFVVCLLFVVIAFYFSVVQVLRLRLLLLILLQILLLLGIHCVRRKNPVRCSSCADFSSATDVMPRPKYLCLCLV